MIEFHRTTEEEKYEICTWQYDGEYAIYNNPPYAEQVKLHRGFANPKNNFYSCTDEGRLIGYINLIEEETELDERFVQATYTAWKHLIRDPLIYDMVWGDSRGRDMDADEE